MSSVQCAVHVRVGHASKEFWVLLADFSCGNRMEGYFGCGGRVGLEHPVILPFLLIFLLDRYKCVSLVCLERKKGQLHELRVGWWGTCAFQLFSLGHCNGFQCLCGRVDSSHYVWIQAVVSSLCVRRYFYLCSFIWRSLSCVLGFSGSICGGWFCLKAVSHRRKLWTGNSFMRVEIISDNLRR